MSEPQEIILSKKTLCWSSVRPVCRGYRMVQIGCTTLDNAYELTIVDKDYHSKICGTAQREMRFKASALSIECFLYEMKSMTCLH